MGIFSKKQEPNEATTEQPLVAYKVTYKGGHPDYPKAKVGALAFEIFADRFEFKPTNASKWFKPMKLPYGSVTDLSIVDRQVGTAEGILGGLNSRQLNQPNNIRISFPLDGLPIVLRLEMLTGITVMGQAKKCQEFEDRLNTQGIRAKFARADDSGTQPALDAAQEIKKYADLRRQGILTDEEFNAKKKQLLGL